MSVVEMPLSRPTATVQRWPLWLAGLLVLVMVGGIGFVAGRRSAPAPQTLHGDAYVGLHMGSVRVNGAVYGIGPDVTWFDTTGGEHEGTWPTCLATVGSTVRITFGTSLSEDPSGSRPHSVAWVDCRSAKVIR